MLTVLVVDNASRVTDNKPFLKSLLRRLRELGVDSIVRVTRASEIDTSIAYSAAILTGSPMLLTEPLLVECVSANIATLLQLACPVLGICFGMQVMVMAYGGSLKRLSTFQSGTRSVTFDDDSVLGAGTKTVACVTEAYEDSVSLIPKGFRVVGVDSANHSVKAIERLGPPYRAAVLFHPEAGTLNQRVLENFLRTASDYTLV